MGFVVVVGFERAFSDERERERDDIIMGRESSSKMLLLVSDVTTTCSTRRGFGGVVAGKETKDQNDEDEDEDDDAVFDEDDAREKVRAAVNLCESSARMKTMVMARCNTRRKRRKRRVSRRDGDRGGVVVSSGDDGAKGRREGRGRGRWWRRRMLRAVDESVFFRVKEIRRRTVASDAMRAIDASEENGGRFIHGRDTDADEKGEEKYGKERRYHRADRERTLT